MLQSSSLFHVCVCVQVLLLMPRALGATLKDSPLQPKSTPTPSRTPSSHWSITTAVDRILVSSAAHRKPYMPKSNSGEIFRSHGRKMWRKFGQKLCRFSSFNFQENGLHEISKEIGGKIHEPLNKFLSPRDTGSLGDNKPKGPSRTTIVLWRVSWARAPKKFGTEVRNRYGDCSEMLVFQKEKKQNRGTDNQKLRPWQNTMDSSAVVPLSSTWLHATIFVLGN